MCPTRGPRGCSAGTKRRLGDFPGIKDLGDPGPGDIQPYLVAALSLKEANGCLEVWVCRVLQSGA